MKKIKNFNVVQNKQNKFYLKNSKNKFINIKN